MSGMWVGRSAPPAGLTRWASSHPAYGLLVLVFQEGWALEGVLSFEATGIIESWLPLFLFSILLGLSMDYDLLLMAANGPTSVAAASASQTCRPQRCARNRRMRCEDSSVIGCS